MSNALPRAVPDSTVEQCSGASCCAPSPVPQSAATTLPAVDDCCAADACCAPAAQSTAAVAIPAGASVFRIPTMDCAVEESDIRRALDKVDGIRSMNFQLGARTVAIQASEDALTAAVAAIRKAGYEPTPSRGREMRKLAGKTTRSSTARA